MKVFTLALTAATAGAVLASPHNKRQHGHAHLHEINKRTQTETTWVAGPTAYAFVLDGKTLSVDEVCNGIKDNSLKWQDNAPAGLCSSSSSASSSSSSTSSTSSTVSSSSATSSTTTGAVSAGTGGAFFGKPGTSTNSAAGSASSAWQNWGGSGSNIGGSTGVDSAFPDGQLDCGTFPSQYGAVKLDYLGMGGWSGLQAVTFGAGVVSHIVTGVSGQSCSEGMMCSYACPPGYQKAQWPSTQGATGQSVGGIQCSGGKLRLTNSGLSSSLCIPGKGGVQVKNSAGSVVAVCRTDYPGTESETIPVELQPGESNALTNPDASTYYSWQGKATSAQYYLNPIGVPASQGCQWSSAGSNMGNWAPINFGVGYKDGKTWLSIFQNKPTTYNSYEGSVEITGDLSDKCSYKNGQYCGATGCNADGCTVSSTVKTSISITNLSTGCRQLRNRYLRCLKLNCTLIANDMTLLSCAYFKRRLKLCLWFSWR